jgi:malate dehydrogenase (oxaloacetate-decarboxylating)
MSGVTAAQRPFVASRDTVSGWALENPPAIGLIDVVRNARPTALIGTSGQAGAFTEAAVRAMAAAVERPVIFPLSNPVSRCEATPDELMAWSDGRALIGTGSPFPSVRRHNRTVPVDQTNNSYIFPGVGLGVLASGATRISDAMFMAAAKALATLSPAARATKDPDARLLPPVTELRGVATAVAEAVALQAQRDGLAPARGETATAQRIAALMWEPVYQSYLPNS